MLKAYKYRINPSKKQETLLEKTLDICCELYNAALQERCDAYDLWENFQSLQCSMSREAATYGIQDGGIFNHCNIQ